MSKKVRKLYREALLELADEIRSSIDETDVMMGNIRITKKREMSMAVKLMQIADETSELTISQLGDLIDFSHTTLTKIKKERNEIMHLKSVYKFLESVESFANALYNPEIEENDNQNFENNIEHDGVS